MKQKKLATQKNKPLTPRQILTRKNKVDELEQLALPIEERKLIIEKKIALVKLGLPYN